MEIIVTKGEVYVHSTLETGDMACYVGPHCSGSRGKVPRLYWVFLWEGVGAAGWVYQVSLGLYNLSSLRRLWAIGMVLSYWEPGSGVI